MPQSYSLPPSTVIKVPTYHLGTLNSQLDFSFLLLTPHTPTPPPPCLLVLEGLPASNANPHAPAADLLTCTLFQALRFPRLHPPLRPTLSQKRGNPGITTTSTDRRGTVTSQQALLNWPPPTCVRDPAPRSLAPYCVCSSHVMLHVISFPISWVSLQCPSSFLGLFPSFT